MIGVQFNTAPFSQSLREIQRRFRPAMEAAVLRTAKVGIEKIVERTAEPPIPHAKVYERTNRLISGWSPAGNFLGVRVPPARPTAQNSNEGDFRFVSNESEISFTAINSVPYALFVELTGTWIIPPPRQKRRAPYLMVTNTTKEMESAGTFEANVENAWDEII